MTERFNNVDFEQAKRDSAPFIKNSDMPQVWSVDFFSTITKDLLTVIQ
jgi:hypothetical protein